jgi:1,4-dihydroxy-2-naphthoate octaprenyltransferase
MPSFRAILGVTRAPFLVLSITLVAAGSAASAYDGGFSLQSTLLALVGLVALHVAVNSLNEASDFRTGIDFETERTPFSGGSGTLPAGGMSYVGALVVGLSGVLVGVGVGVWFLQQYGLALLPIVLLGAVAVLGYSDFLARIGVGELFAGLGLGALPVLGTALVQDGRIGPAAIAVAFPAFFMTFNLLLLNEFPDEEADRAGGRKNLVLLFGRPAAARVYAGAALAVPATILAAVALGALPWICLPAVLPSLALMPALRWAFQLPHEPAPLPALGANVVWNLATNTLLAVCLAIAMVWV